MPLNKKKTTKKQSTQSVAMTWGIFLCIDKNSEQIEDLKSYYKEIPIEMQTSFETLYFRGEMVNKIWA